MTKKNDRFFSHRKGMHFIHIYNKEKIFRF